MSNNKYEKPARPFELWNIGDYETVYWQEREDEYLLAGGGAGRPRSRGAGQFTSANSILTSVWLPGLSDLQKI